MHVRSLARASRAAFPATAVLWAALVVSAPWLAASRSSIGVRIATASYVIGSLVCHQRPDRSFHVGGAQLPVCGRCTGLYLSAAVGVIATWAWLRGGPASRPVRWRAWLLLSALPTLCTFAFEVAGLWMPSNVSRAAAGAPLGLVAGALLTESLSFRGKLAGCERTRQNG